MPRSAGTMILPAGNPVLSGTTISSSVQNATMADVANEITNSIPRDGSAPPTANIPMGNFKITGLLNGSAAQDAAAFGQIAAAITANNANYLPLAGGTLTGALNEKQGADIASAATIDLTAATGNYEHITGTTTITAITLAQGARRTVVFDGILTLTNGASLLLPTSANIITAAGDTAVFIGEAAGVVRCIDYTRKTGTALVVSLQPKYAIVADQKATNTNGGTFTSGAWRTRDLNTEVYDPDNIVSIASNQITLAAGTYIVEWTAPAFSVNVNQSRLFNITDTAVVSAGTSEYAGVAAISGASRSHGMAGFTIATTKVYEIQHQCQTTAATNGLGLASGSAFTVTNEEYTLVKITKTA